jgi:hypothetical protein
MIPFEAVFLREAAMTIAQDLGAFGDERLQKRGGNCSVAWCCAGR